MTVEIIKEPEHYKVLSEAKLYDKMNECSIEDAKVSVDKAMLAISDSSKELDALEKGEDYDSAVIAEAYAYSREAYAFFKAKFDDIKDAVKLAMEHKDEDIEVTAMSVKFALSKKSSTVLYDKEALKSERPDVWDKVAKKFGSPMNDDDRSELERQIEDAQSKLLELQKKLAEDNAANQEVFNEEMFEILLAQDDSLKKFKEVKHYPRKFYFKEMKNAK